MRAIVVDDEKLALESMHVKLTHIECISEVHTFFTAEAALEHFAENGADIAFLDIQMPRISGLTLAARMREMKPSVIIIFITGYEEYALDAHKLHVDGYLMKPVSEEDINSELHALEQLCRQPEQSKHIRVQCFGNFEVFVDGKTLRFKRVQTKELLAYLVDRNGAAVNTSQLCAVLWEDSTEVSDEEQRRKLRHLISDLTLTLNDVNAGEIIVKHRNSFAVAVGSFDCDYYDFLTGKPAVAQKYRGEYMAQYSWAESTTGTLA